MGDLGEAAGAADAGESFPRRSARTRRFTLGAPRTLKVAPDGSLVAFLRSSSGVDPQNALWVFDVERGEERLVVDPRAAGAALDAELPAAERARRERARETGEGIVAYSLDARGRRAAMVVGGRIVVAGLADGTLSVLEAADGAYDPQLDPTGMRVAYVTDGALRVVGIDEPDRLLVSEDGVTWGVADFIASEELSRTRGFWWSPDGRCVLAERVDDSAVALWHIASPVEPWREPVSIRYPAAGTRNAECSLALFGLDGRRVEVSWDRDRFCYLAEVVWTEGAPLTLVVLSRDQRAMSILAVDTDSGSTTELQRVEDPSWVDVVDGSPSWHDGRLVTVADRGDARRVLVDGEVLSPDGLQVRSLLGVDDDGVLVSASREDPTVTMIVRIGWDASVETLTDEEGVHSGVMGGGTIVVTSATMSEDQATVRVSSLERGTQRRAVPRVVRSLAESPGVVAQPRFLRLGERQLAAALLLPSDGGAGPLPVVLDPYGGPHAQRVLRSRAGLASSQWLADQGFAVLVVDGRGTPGRGPAWEREVRGDLAGPVLEDQVDALQAAALVEPRLDLGRVGIRGWSFGGYLAALAVLRRPDVFHAAVAGAPVTEWRLYDTAYTERYLGHPEEEPESYERSSLIPLAPGLRRPLMLIHGLADDNVVVAHTLALSRALLEAGRSHTVLPLSGVTHMTPQEEVAENLLVLQIEFLRSALQPDPHLRSGS